VQTLPRSISSRKSGVLSAALLLAVATQPASLLAAPSAVKFTQSAETVDAYDFVEVRLNVDNPDAANPFTDVVVEGEFACEGSQAVRVDGFCDSADGSIFRMRFMPREPGKHSYSVKYKQGKYEAQHSGSFTARDAKRRGLVRVDKEHPWHFLWEGTGEHYFWNATTTYWLMGWDDEQIRKNIDRLRRLKVNRLRVAINGRVKNGRAWYENVFPTDKFTFLLNPWVAKRPHSVESPGFDVSCFNIPYWQKIERMLRYARDKDMIISVIFYVDGRRPGVDPFGKERMGGQDEQRYYRYAVARFAAFSNVMWDVTNEYRLFRNDPWAEKMGSFIKQCDPYDHLTSTHGHGDFRFRTSPWADFAMYQRWDEHGGYAFMLKNRQEQAGTGRPMPQVNEEYGYEDHYPIGWGGNRKAPARCADNRRRLAWGIYMAGCYQTTGERADRGTGWAPDSGGGWLNGRGDDTMVMLSGYAHIVDFFTSILWWELHPDNDFFQIPPIGSVKAELTHVVYTRDTSGRATIFLDGVQEATAEVPGNLSNWDGDYRLALSNELTRDRHWLGELHLVAIYSRALSEQQVKRNFQAGADKEPSGTQVLYNFREGSGDTVRDVSNEGQPLNLKIENTTAVKWLPKGGLAIRSPVLIASPTPATKIIDSIKQSNGITIEAWIKPANNTQTGPARIVTVSKDTGNRNFTLGQKADAYETRLRTTSTSPNGEPALSSPSGDDAARRISASRSKKGDLAVIYFPVGGEITVKQGVLKKGLEAEWFNPRNGRRSPARTHKANVFRTPDDRDWVLLFCQG